MERRGLAGMPAGGRRSFRFIPMSETSPVLALSGGVGGAKLALGLYRILPPDTLTVVANTGDDFEHLGLSISPDLDTLLYTLSGNDNLELGWGRRGETWTFMAALEALGGETWFRLGDGDLATHLQRTRRRQPADSLSARSPCRASSAARRSRARPPTSWASSDCLSSPPPSRTTTAISTSSISPTRSTPPQSPASTCRSC